MDANIHADKQRPVTFKATGSRGSDMSALFAGQLTWESDDPSIAQIVVGDLASLTQKAAAQGVEGTVKVRARGTLDGIEYVAEATITVVAAEVPPEVIASVQLDFGDEEAIGS